MESRKIDVVVSFDTTGSMYNVLSQVRRDVSKFVTEMFKGFGSSGIKTGGIDLRMSIIAHGDYCDKDDPYTIRILDFTNDVNALCDFVQTTEPTYGGDADECYELVLHSVHAKLNWRDDADKVFIMIGDASPHGPRYTYRDMEPSGLDWMEESKVLKDMGIKVYAVHALSYYRKSSRGFYSTVADITGGMYLTLDMFSDVFNIIKAICYKEENGDNFDEFIEVLKANKEMTNTLDINIRRLQGLEVESIIREMYETRHKEPKKRTSSSSGIEGKIKEMEKLVPVLPGRFQTMVVDKDTPIKAFVESNGITFKKGRGFYELSKAETIQQYKEVIIQDRETGEMFNGSQVREELKLQPQTEKGGVSERIHKDATKKFRVFVQSTSVNRRLVAGTTFLYEVGDLADTGTIVEEKPVATTATFKAETTTEKPVEVATEKPVEVVAKPEETAEAVETGGEVKPADGVTTKKSKASTKKKKKDAKEFDVVGELTDPSFVKDVSKFDMEFAKRSIEASADAIKTDSMVMAIIGKKEETERTTLKHLFDEARAATSSEATDKLEERTEAEAGTSAESAEFEDCGDVAEMFDVEVDEGKKVTEESKEEAKRAEARAKAEEELAKKKEKVAAELERKLKEKEAREEKRRQAKEEAAKERKWLNKSKAALKLNKACMTTAKACETYIRNRNTDKMLTQLDKLLKQLEEFKKSVEE